jgi:hypothetical protein
MLLRLLLLLAVVGGAAGAASAQGEVCVSTAPGDASIRCDIPLATDSLLYIENQNVARLLVDLNGYVFKLATDSAEVAQSENAFPLPRQGVITINIGAYLLPEDNVIEFIPQGPSGSSIPRIIIANVLLEGQTVAYAVRGLEPFPEQFDLPQNYPNPFSTSTSFDYSIPAERTTGLPVRLMIYDTAGRLVRVLVNERRYPGAFTAVWDGRTASGVPAAGGVYIAHFVAGDEVERSITLTRIP